MRKLIASCALLALAAAPLGCDLNKLSASRVMVATLFATPPVELQPAAIAGLDAGGFDAGGLSFDGGFDLDAGFPFDAGGFLADSGFNFDGGTLTFPSETGAMVFFGKRSSASLDVAPEAEAGATLTLTAAGGEAITLENGDAGTYFKNSLQDPSFRYEEGKTYTFTATVGGETFVGEVESVPRLERINQFHPAKGFIEQTAKTPFSFSRPDPPAGQERNLGFVNVFPVSAEGQGADPTYTNVPTTPLQFLKLAAAPSEWKQTSVVIPGEAFPEPNKNYIILFQSVKLGGPKSDNLFAGSAILAGTADVAVVRTK